MLYKTKIRSSIVGLGLLLSIVATPSVRASSRTPIQQTNQFHRIEQPFELKLAVILGGLTLMGLELWWFLLSKPQLKQATTNQGARE